VHMALKTRSFEFMSCIILLMILCISPHTNVEHSWTIPDFQIGGVFRVKEETALASGKGINVARSMKILGADVFSLGFVAGHTGHWFTELAAEEGLAGEWTWIEGEGRLAVAIVDPKSDQDATLISSTGPQVSGLDWERLSAAVIERVPSAQGVCCSGSLPPGSPLTNFTRLIQEIERRGRSVWLDHSGEVLKAGLMGKPQGIKVNAVEAGEITGLIVKDFESAFNAAYVLRSLGTRWAIITLGKQGAILDTGQVKWIAQPPVLADTISSVGSGDAFLAGWMVGLARGMLPSEALRMAAAAGAANTQLFGGGRFRLEDYGRILPLVKVEPG